MTIKYPCKLQLRISKELQLKLIAQSMINQISVSKVCRILLDGKNVEEVLGNDKRELSS
jgi:hypothetical protein